MFMYIDINLLAGSASLVGSFESGRMELSVLIRISLATRFVENTWESYT